MAVVKAGIAVRGAAAAVILLAALGLSACMPGPDAVEDFAGVPLVQPEVVPDVVEGEDAEENPAEGAVELVELEVSEGEARAVYLENGGQIALVLWGSSTCPPVGSAMTVVADADNGNAVRVELVPIPADQPCTADYTPHTTVFLTPVNVTTTQPLRIAVGDEEVVLPVK